MNHEFGWSASSTGSIIVPLSRGAVLSVLKPSLSRDSTDSSSMQRFGRRKPDKNCLQWWRITGLRQCLPGVPQTESPAWLAVLQLLLPRLCSSLTGAGQAGVSRVSTDSLRPHNLISSSRQALLKHLILCLGCHALLLWKLLGCQRFSTMTSL